MKRLYIFRSNLKILEYYHKFKKLDGFKKKCHDFYLLMGLEYLEMNEFDEVVVWRLHPKDKEQKDIIFDVNGKKFIQKWVHNFKECLNYPSPTISFFRGGFKEYCKITQMNHKFFNIRLYLGAGKRVTPQYNGRYSRILIEGDQDRKDDRIPFLKTCNPNIFFPKQEKEIYDICFISNFTQIKMKGQRFLFDKIMSSDFLQNKKIIHLGNEPQFGKKLAKNMGIKNIEFLGWMDRKQVNNYLNKSKFGIVCSTQDDGCPRVSTEILCSGTPLLIRDTTRLLPYYKNYGVVEFNRDNFDDQIEYAFKNYNKLKSDLMNNMVRFCYYNICQKNIKHWKKI